MFFLFCFFFHKKSVSPSPALSALHTRPEAGVRSPDFQSKRKATRKFPYFLGHFQMSFFNFR